MDDTYMKYTTIMNTMFEEKFMEAYRDANNKKRRRILPYLQAIHRRWFYATLVEHTPFSPANLTECALAHFKESPDQYPVAVLRTPSKVTGLTYRMVSYSIENHPVVEDLRMLMHYCTPHIDLYEQGGFKDEQSVELSQSLSITDPHYSSFLMEIAMGMKLLSKVRSLHILRMEPSKKSEEILSRPNEEILQDIINTSITLAALGMRQSIPMPEHIFTESFIRSLLTAPMETDEIFARVFEVMGYNIEDLLEVSSMPMADGMSPEHLGLDMELLSGTFVMGIVLDRFFFTPFGHFLRLIRPMYALPFAFYEEVSDYIDACEDPDEAFVAFFAPCSSYTLTGLGLKALNVKPTAENYFDASELDFENMRNAIFIDDYTFKTFVEMAQQLAPLALMGGLPGLIHTFRIRLESDTSIWMHLNVPDTFTLANLYDEITQYFNLKNNGDFSFFHDKTENRFAEYPSLKRASKSKNPKTPAEECLLSDLDFGHMEHLILATYSQNSIFAQEPPTIRLQLERLSEKAPEFGEMYPQPGRMSKNMKLQADWDL